MKQFCENQKGFTLLEVVLSISIFSTAILLFATFFINSSAQNSRQDAGLVAENLARQIASEWKSGQGKIMDAENISDGLLPRSGKTQNFSFTDLLDLAGKTITLPPVTINGSEYTEVIELIQFPIPLPDHTVDNTSLIVIKVKVLNSDGKVLSLLNTSMTRT